MQTNSLIFEILNQACDALFPKHCLVCQSSRCKSYLCSHCQPPTPLGSSEQYCPQCYAPLLADDSAQKCKICLHIPVLFREMRFMWDYSDIKTQSFLKTMKYQPSPLLCRMAAKLLTEKVLGRFTYRDWDLVVPVPLSDEALKVRKFNQCSAIAKQLILGIKKESKNTKLAHWILKHRGYKSRQALLPHIKRIENVKKSFQANQNAFKNKSVLLVEDIVTTGATINSATKAILDAGAIAVDVIAVARSQAWTEFRWLLHKKNR